MRESPQLKIGDVSLVTGIPIARLGRWFDRRTIKPNRSDKTSTGTGDHRTFSRNTVIQIAIAKLLIDLAIGAGPANKAAAVFANEAKLFPCGKTHLVIGPDSTSIRNTFHDTPLTDVSKDGVCIVLEINRVVEHVDSILKAS